MANHESAKKAYRQSQKKQLINKTRKSRIKTLLKKVLDAINKNDIELMKSTFINFQSEIMKAAAKKVLKLNTASRKVSKISNLIKKTIVTTNS